MSELNMNMNQVFSKLSDLKTIFKFGEKVVPIIQSLIEFMKEIVPLLEKINSSIADSTKQMPKASFQINDVTNATELATNEILDLVDEISNTLQNMEDSFNDQIKLHEKKEKIRVKLEEKLKDNPEVFELFNEYKELVPTDKEIRAYMNIVNEIKEDTYKITLSLQVQDITTQQLATVNHLILSINQRLSSLIDNIEKSELHSEFEDLDIQVPKTAHYDPKATYNNSEGKQDSVDEIVDLEKQNQMTSQEEIDKLFK